MVVDVTESVESGAEILKVFRNVTSKPIKALIFTHNHADHSYGAKVRLFNNDMEQLLYYAIFRYSC